MKILKPPINKTVDDCVPGRLCVTAWRKSTLSDHGLNNLWQWKFNRNSWKMYQLWLPHLTSPSEQQAPITSCQHSGSPPFVLFPGALINCLFLPWDFLHLDHVTPLPPKPCPLHFSSLGYTHISNSSWQDHHVAVCWEDHGVLLMKGVFRGYF